MVVSSTPREIYTCLSVPTECCPAILCSTSASTAHSRALFLGSCLILITCPGLQPLEESRRIAEQIDVRSLYAAPFPHDATLDSMMAVFEAAGPVKALRMRRHLTTKDFRGSIFVEFGSEEAAQKVCRPLYLGLASRKEGFWALHKLQLSFGFCMPLSVACHLSSLLTMRAADKPQELPYVRLTENRGMYNIAPINTLSLDVWCRSWRSVWSLQELCCRCSPRRSTCHARKTPLQPKQPLLQRRPRQLVRHRQQVKHRQQVPLKRLRALQVLLPFPLSECHLSREQ